MDSRGSKIQVKNGAAIRNGGSHPSAIVERPQPQPPKENPAQKHALIARGGFAAALVAAAFVMPLWVPVRAVDPAQGWLVIEPIVGLFLFWPLSRVLIRASTLFWGLALSLLPAASLVWIRLYASQRNVISGTEPNLSFGAMIFFGVLSVTAYLLFRTPPRQ